jgi:CheY-like chemotaxis protein
MDHMMPGMDGFQAVKAIKENPATATIPVMMYTSQSGELYVGQARALGAVGVLPKQIKPVEVREVLRSLHLLPGDAPAHPARRAGDLAGLTGVESVNAPADWSDLHRWLQEMLADHNRALRADLETTVSRVLGDRLPPGGRAPGQVPPRMPFWPAGALIAALAAVAATFVWLHLDSEAKWRAATRQNIGLLSELSARRAGDVVEATAEVARRDQPSDRKPDWSAGVVAALEWSVNQGATYPPETLPFDDVRLVKLTGLLDRLRALDFRGTVRLEGHVGDFCMRRARDETWEMAADDLPVSRCDRMGLLPEEARAESSRQSVAFANYLAELELRGGPISVEIEPLGNSRPLFSSPATTAELTAGEWNQIARQNQRVEVKLAPVLLAE